jgi:hypothetical protein
MVGPDPPLLALIGLVVCALLAGAALVLRSCGAQLEALISSRSAGAQERAEALLKELLTEVELRQLDRSGYLAVPSRSRPGRIYRVPLHPGRTLVEVYQDGIPLMALCVQSVEPIPDGDAVLMHKLMIEGDEEAYLRIANRFELARYRPGRRAVPS